MSNLRARGINPDAYPLSAGGTQCCKHCKFWLVQLPEAEGSHGICRRRAPVAHVPLTAPEQWCGEFAWSPAEREELEKER